MPATRKSLHHADLSKLESAEQIEEWRNLAAKRGEKISLLGGIQPHERGIHKTADDLGIAPVEVRATTQVAALTGEAKETAREVELDDDKKS